MLCTTLDHLVITAPSVEMGIQYVEQILGVGMERGGKHPRMGTHNALLRLGGGAYLEVIAVDPEATPPGRPRWFELDRPGRPRLAGWVARTDDIARAHGALGNVLGALETMSRGDLSWRITIPEDGGLPFGGAAPMLIQWAAGPRPSDRLPDSGCSLVRFERFHPQADAVNVILDQVGLQALPAVVGPAPALVAHIQTPSGLRLLGPTGDIHG
ncbi:MAG TPA: VOC family protein [Holophaga sp.]|nr:VOC family protein [Holophaga sp.]